MLGEQREVTARVSEELTGGPIDFLLRCAELLLYSVHGVAHCCFGSLKKVVEWPRVAPADSPIRSCQYVGARVGSFGGVDQEKCFEE